VGIERYDSPELIREVLAGADSELLIVTVGDRHTTLGLPLTAILGRLQDLNPTLVGTTCHAQSTGEAISVARLLKDSLGVNLIKLDVRPDEYRSLPDNAATIKAAEVLVREGFDVMPMLTPDPVAAAEAEKVGCCALRLLAGPLRSGLGVTNLAMMLAVKASVGVPCVGEGGVATASDAALMVERGIDAVLVNSAITKAGSPALMVRAMSHAVTAGRLCYVAGRMPVEPWADEFRH
jgi:thiazole synthase